MKKSLCVITVILMLLTSFTACSSPKADTPVPESTAEAVPEEKAGDIPADGPSEGAEKEAEETGKPSDGAITLDNVRDYIVGIDEPVELLNGVETDLKVIKHIARGVVRLSSYGEKRHSHNGELFMSFHNIVPLLR